MCVCVYMLFTPLGDGHFLVLFNHFITTSDICYSELSHFALVNSFLVTTMLSYFLIATMLYFFYCSSAQQLLIDTVLSDCLLL
jgi:hypothetical protein